MIPLIWDLFSVDECEWSRQLENRQPEYHYEILKFAALHLGLACLRRLFNLYIFDTFILTSKSVLYTEYHPSFVLVWSQCADDLVAKLNLCWKHGYKCNI